MEKTCTRCICDTSIPGIIFDEKGVCQFCKIHDYMETQYPLNDEGKKKLDAIIDKIKKDGRGKEHDCIVGVSGGRDSTYLLYLAVKCGLRPLAVHFDNGWNSEIAVTNIKNSTDKLGVALYTHVADWEEFRELQKAFLRASVSDADVPTDVAIFGTLHQAAAREGIKYILNGHSFRTEGVMPKGWTYMDGRYINSVNKIHGKGTTKTIPNFTMLDLLKYTFIKGIKVVPFINFFPYNHDEIGKILETELGWRYYGGHHHESHYTHFFQSYYLPVKFGIDKRKIEYSALVRSGQMNREQAISEITSASYPYKEELIDYVLSKMQMDKEEFKQIMKSPVKTFHDYPTYFPLMKMMAKPIKTACKMGLLPELLYYKYVAYEK